MSGENPVYVFASVTDGTSASRRKDGPSISQDVDADIISTPGRLARNAGRHSSRCVIDHGVYARDFAASIETTTSHVFLNGLRSQSDAGHGACVLPFVFVFRRIGRPVTTNLQKILPSLQNTMVVTGKLPQICWAFCSFPVTTVVFCKLGFFHISCCHSSPCFFAVVKCVVLYVWRQFTTWFQNNENSDPNPTQTL